MWLIARERLDRSGSDRRGTVATPELSSAAMLALTSLLGRRPGTRLDLAVLEHCLAEVGVGSDLDEALTLLGAPASAVAAAARMGAARRDAVKAAVTDATALWPEPWAAQWAEWVVRTGQTSGMAPADATSLLFRCRAVLDMIDRATESIARTDLAAQVVGTAHGLDDGSVTERCVQRALRHRISFPEDVDTAPVGRDAWQAAGVTTDSVSAPVLTWRLDLDGSSPLGAITSAANDAGVPIHLSMFALRAGPLSTAGTGPVLVVENPRIVEAASERGTPWPVVATNGNPPGAATTLIDGLLTAGVEVRVHTDFDSAGIGICRRLHARGCVPWRMSAADYAAAVDRANSMGVVLPTDATTCGPTPWGPALEAAFDSARAVVHEELLIEVLLDPTTWQRSAGDAG